MRLGSFTMPAIGELVAPAEHRAVPVALLDHLPDQALGALTQRRAFDRLKPDIVACDLAKLPDIAGRLPAIGDEIRAPAGARQRNVSNRFQS